MVKCSSSTNKPKEQCIDIRLSVDVRMTALILVMNTTVQSTLQNRVSNQFLIFRVFPHLKNTQKKKLKQVKEFLFPFYFFKPINVFSISKYSRVHVFD